MAQLANPDVHITGSLLGLDVGLAEAEGLALGPGLEPGPEPPAAGCWRARSALRFSTSTRSCLSCAIDLLSRSCQTLASASRATRLRWAAKSAAALSSR